MAYSPQWMPDSAEVIVSAKGALWRLAIAEGSVAERLPFVGEDGTMPVVSRPAPGRAARLVYVRSFADHNIWRVDAPVAGAAVAAPPFAAITSTRREGTPAFSPDGQRVAFISTRSGENELWVSDPAGANAVQLTSMGAIPGFCRWSPDGKTIAFHSNPDGSGDIFVVPADGGKPRNLTNHPATDTFPSFSRDGKSIYFTSTRSGTNLIWKVLVSGGDPVQVSPVAALVPIESPDGASLYFAENATTDRAAPLARMSLANGEIVRLPLRVVSTSYAVVEGGVYHIEREAADTRLMYFDLASQRSAVVASHLGSVGLGLTASPDGRSVLYSRVDSSVDDLMLVENFR